MIKITILSIGKTKEAWLQEALDEYIKRLKTKAEITWKLAKNDLQLEAFAMDEPKPICLDPKGSLLTSEEFSELIQAQGSRMAFIIGGPEGIPEALKKAGPVVSFSKMTFTHQITRLVLLEQLYRAFEIAKGSAYHK